MKRLLLLLLAVTACAGDATSIHITVAAPPDQQLDSLALVVMGERQSLPVSSELTVYVPDDWAADVVHLDLEAIAADATVASGSADVMLERGGSVDATIDLTSGDCSECTPGDVRCDGNGVATCSVVGGCAIWGDAVACPMDTPFCTDGACAATCSDECTAGAKTCDGTGAEKTCGNNDSDTCTDWISTPCGMGETCVSGSCMVTSACPSTTCTAITENYPAVIGWMAADTDYLYWATDTVIMRRRWTDGMTEMFATGTFQSYEIELDATHVYWLTSTNALVRKAKAGGSVQTLVPAPASQTSVSDLALDDTYVYWSESSSAQNAFNGIRRRPKAGGGSVQDVVTGTRPAYGFFIDNGEVIYFLGHVFLMPQDDEIFKKPIIGGTPVSLFHAPDISELALDATHVYVMTTDVVRATRTNGTLSTIASTVSGVHLAVDATHVMWADNGLVYVRAKTGGSPKSVGTGNDDSELLITPDWFVYSHDTELKLAPRCACE